MTHSGASPHLVVGAIQMDCQPGDKEGNVRKALQLLEQGAEAGARLLVLPELFSTGYRVEERDVELAEPIDGPTLAALHAFAQRRKVYIAGAVLESSQVRGVVHDTAFLLGPEGVLGTYRKCFLWHQERLRFAAGTGPGTPILLPGLPFPCRVGLQICYEIGFPEGARHLTLAGADILVYPSAFGAPRRYIWDVATRARAVENGCFVIATNRIGSEKDSQFGGMSRITNPQGRVLAELADGEGVITAAIDLAEVSAQRQQVPYLRDLIGSGVAPRP